MKKSTNIWLTPPATVPLILWLKSLRSKNFFTLGLRTLLGTRWGTFGLQMWIILLKSFFSWNKFFFTPKPMLLEQKASKKFHLFQNSFLIHDNLECFFFYLIPIWFDIMNITLAPMSANSIIKGYRKGVVRSIASPCRKRHSRGVNRGTNSCTSKYRTRHFPRNHNRIFLYQNIMSHVVAFGFVTFRFFDGVKKSTTFAVRVTQNFMLTKYKIKKVVLMNV